VTEEELDLALSRIRSFQVSALMDALHRAHGASDNDGDRCPTCADLIADANKKADAAYRFVAEDLGWPLPVQP
jgi:hypothetical protein